MPIFLLPDFRRREPSGVGSNIITEAAMRSPHYNRREWRAQEIRALLRGAAFILILLIGLPLTASAQNARLRVSESGRHLLRGAEGKPFFYLADTVWNIVHILNREDMRLYLDHRAANEFNVVFFSAISESGGSGPNAYGDKPFVDDDFLRPAVTPGNDPNDPEQYDFWDHLDFFLHESSRRGIYAAMNPIYASWYVRDGHVTQTNAEEFGRFWGRRYGSSPSIIWVLGGDIAPDFKPEHLEIHRQMARGIALGATGKEDYSILLMTYHPPGQSKAPGARTSSKWYHDEPWLDFNMLQTGQADHISYDLVNADYQRMPVKPVLDGEPWYEAHPHKIRPGNRLASDFDVRKRAYWSVFAGACGHAYGEGSVMLLWSPGQAAFRDTEVIPWKQALDRKGGLQTKYLRRLIESRPMLDRVPDQSLLAYDAMEFNDRIQATRGQDYALIYSTSGNRIDVHLGRISGENVRAWWFNPREGSAKEIGVFPNKGSREFLPPSTGIGHDWVLVLDDTTRQFAAPGVRLP
ncbi:MAG: glycoside hydrolase family 140 protein [Blastocatellia bacterium]